LGAEHAWISCPLAQVPDLAGYRIHYGIVSGNYTHHIDVGRLHLSGQRGRCRAEEDGAGEGVISNHGEMGLC